MSWRVATAEPATLGTIGGGGAAGSSGHLPGGQTEETLGSDLEYRAGLGRRKGLNGHWKQEDQGCLGLSSPWAGEGHAGRPRSSWQDEHRLLSRAEGGLLVFRNCCCPGMRPARGMA